MAQADEEFARILSQAEQQKKELLESALVHKNQIIAEGKALAQQEQQKILDQATHNATLILDKAQQDAELKGRELDAHFEHGVKNTALTLLKKIFGENKTLQEQYLSTLVEEFSSSYKK